MSWTSSQNDKTIKQIEYTDAIIYLVKENSDRVEELKNNDLARKFHNCKGSWFRWNINFLQD